MPIDDALEEIKVEKKYQNNDRLCAISINSKLLDSSEILRNRKRQKRFVVNCPVFKNRYPYTKNILCEYKRMSYRLGIFRCPLYTKCNEREEEVTTCR
jgi:hypothetical protein